jgi:hypothetical protein
LTAAVNILTLILNNTRTNPIIFRTIKLLNEDFELTDDEEEHMVATDNASEDPQILGEELISLLPRGEVLYFHNQSNNVA